MQGGGGWQDADGDGVGTQESGAEEPVESTSAGGSETRKATSAAADKAGAGGSHVARYGLRERVAGRRENPASESSGVGVQEGGREAYGVAGKPSKVGGKEGGREAYGVAENPGGNRERVRGGVELPQGIDTPGVDKFPQGDETPRVAIEGEGVTGEDGRGWGGYRNPPTT